MVMFFVLLILLEVLIGIYMYRFIRKILNLIIKDYKHKKLINIILTLILMIPAIGIRGLWIIVVLHLFFITVLVDIIYSLACKISKKKNKTVDKIYNSGIISIAISAIILVYGYINMHNVVQTDYTVYTDKNIRDEGYKVAFISDLHYGLNMDGAKLKEYCSQIENQNPDVVILGGDIVDESTTLTEMKEAFKILSKIKSTYGTFYVYGNHDQATYVSDPSFTEKELSDEITSSGIKILEDDAFKINDEIAVTGRKDKSFGSTVIRKSAEELAKDTKINKNQYNILADHQPGDFDKTSSVGYDVMLSGHTHAGQIWPGGLFIDKLMKNTVCYGHVEKNNMDVIVSSGIAGWGFPVRTEKHCEYVIVNIRNKAV